MDLGKKNRLCQCGNLKLCFFTGISGKLLGSSHSISGGSDTREESYATLRELAKVTQAQFKEIKNPSIFPGEPYQETLDEIYQVMQEGGFVRLWSNHNRLHGS